MGGHLAIVRGEEEMRFLRDLISNTKLDSAWLGATDEREEGHWAWSTGRKCGTRTGLQHSPITSGRPARALPLMAASSQWAWWDLPDTAEPFFHPGFICQWKAASAPPTEERPALRAMPDDAKAFEGKRYKVFPEELTWHRAHESNARRWATPGRGPERR